MGGEHTRKWPAQMAWMDLTVCESESGILAATVWTQVPANIVRGNATIEKMRVGGTGQFQDFTVGDKRIRSRGVWATDDYAPVAEGYMLSIDTWATAEICSHGELQQLRNDHSWWPPEQNEQGRRD